MFLKMVKSRYYTADWCKGYALQNVEIQQNIEIDYRTAMSYIPVGCIPLLKIYL